MKEKPPKPYVAPPITIPERADPFVKELYRQCHALGVPVKHMALKSGVALSTVYGWRLHSSPTARDLEACFNALGLRLAPVPFEEAA